MRFFYSDTLLSSSSTHVLIFTDPNGPSPEEPDVPARYSTKCLPLYCERLLATSKQFHWEECSVGKCHVVAAKLLQILMIIINSAIPNRYFSFTYDLEMVDITLSQAMSTLLISVR